MRFTAAVSQEGSWHVARCREVEVTSQGGQSFDDALTNLREALELYSEDQPFPEGTEAPIIAPSFHPGVSPALPVVSRKGGDSQPPEVRLLQGEPERRKQRQTA